MKTPPRPRNELSVTCGQDAQPVAAVRQRPTSLKLALAAAAALALPLLLPAPTASAGEVQWSVRVGSSDYDRGGRGHHRSGDYSSRRGSYDSRGYHGGGYYKKVWCPPVYRTRYDDCGRAIRVCIRAGYYKQVYVQASYRPSYRERSYHERPRHYTRHSSRSYSRDYSRDYSRRGQWGNRGGSCGY